MDWKIYDKDGKFLEEANCQYDSLDKLTMFYEYTEIRVDFDEKCAYGVK